MNKKRQAIKKQGKRKEEREGARKRKRVKGWGCSSVIECLTRMHEDLVLISSTEKRKRRRVHKKQKQNTISLSTLSAF
jgi:hypothetical protein